MAQVFQTECLNGFMLRSVVDGGMVWTSAGDVAEAVGLRPSARGLATLAEKTPPTERRVCVFDGQGRGNPSKLCLTPEGVYDLMKSLQGPEPAAFLKWMAGGGLAALRAPLTARPPKDHLADALAEAQTLLREAQDRARKAADYVAALQTAIENRP